VRYLISAFVALSLLGCAHPDYEEYRLGTAALGGAYFPMGQAIANVVTQHTPGISMVPIVTRGAIENPRLVSRGDLELALTNADLAYFAYQGRPPYQAKLDIAAAGALHPSVLHLVTSASTGLKNFAELRGKQVAVGPAGGPTVSLTETLLAAHGMSLDDIVPSFLSYSDGFSQLSDGNVDAAFALAGYPAAAVLQAGATDDLVFLELAPEIVERVVTENPYYTLARIPAAIYETGSDITALAVDNVLIINANEDPDTAFAIVSAIYGNLEELRSSVAVARQIDPAHSLDLAIPLHPGARRYFEAAALSGDLR
jgi:TRAP transporter TAXI family solute receptor